MNKVFTGSYEKCKVGNLILISGDRGRSVGFIGKSIPKLAPKRVFWNVWHDNIGKISEEENTRYYIEQYYKQVLLNVDVEEILKDEINPILLCFEDSSEFCHRHIVAAYMELKYKIEVCEIEVDENEKITMKKRPENIKRVLEETIKKYEAELL